MSKILELWFNILNCGEDLKKGNVKILIYLHDSYFLYFFTNHVCNRPITYHKCSLKTNWKLENKATSSWTAGIRLKKYKILKLSIFGVFTNTKKFEIEYIVIVIIWWNDHPITFLCNLKCVWLHLKLKGGYETRLMIIQFQVQLSVKFHTFMLGN